MRTAFLLLQVGWVAACGKPTSDGSASAGPPASASGQASASATPARAPPSAWQGSYQSAPGSLYIPPDWKIRWSGGDAGTGIGEGAVTIAIDPTSHRLAGTVDGPLGPALLEGLAADGHLTANLSRKNPADHGFSGTMMGLVEGERATGTMSVSTGEASTVRVATFSLSPATR